MQSIVERAAELGETQHGYLFLSDPNSTEMVLAWGLRNGSAVSGAQVLNILHSATAAGDPYDVVIVDVVLAGMDVFTLANHIRSETPLAGTRLILLTAFFGAPVPYPDDPLRAVQCAVLGFTPTAAKLLEEAAQPGQILIDAASYEVARETVEARPAESLVIRDGSKAIPVHEVVSLKRVTA